MMNPIEIHISVSAPVLADAVYCLAKALEGNHVTTHNPALLEAAREEFLQPEKQETEKEKPALEPEQTDGVKDGATYSVEEVRAALAELAKTKGRETAKNVLADLGVKSVSNLQPDMFARAMQMMKGV